MEKTAVEWFEQQLDDLDIEIPQSIFEEAKEIEKEQQGYSEYELKKYGEFCVAKFNDFKSVSLNDEYFEQFKKK